MWIKNKVTSAIFEVDEELAKEYIKNYPDLEETVAPKIKKG